MANFTKIQQGILSLSPGAYQRLCSDYYARINNITKIHDVGSKEGTDKTTSGIPDSYIVNNDNTYTLLMYGTVERKAISKIKKDITEAHDCNKTGISIEKVKRIVCFHTCTNITPGKYEEIIHMFDDVSIELIDIDTMAHDIKDKFNSLAVEYFQLPVDTNQISDIDTFIKRYDHYSLNSPLSIKYIERKEKDELIEIINKSKKVTLITGKAGIGKTKLALEVCKELQKQYCCLCVRSNNNDIYEDIKNSIEIEKKYLIFVDDINNLHNLKSFIDLIAISDKEIKVIGTVREYAIKEVLSKIEEYTIPEVFKLNELKDNDIIEILKTNYNIQNLKWQKNITKIANGNPRIAIMTAQALLNGTVESFNSVSEVFREYYDKIIEQNKLGDMEIRTLFYLSVLSPLSIKNEQIKKVLKDHNVYDIEKFDNLNDLELIEFFNKEAIKICDQNFSNYIIYKYLIAEKKISISVLLEQLYPAFMKRLIESINMICEIFNSEETFDYIKNEINQLWDSKYFDNDEFLKAFHNLNLSKTLLIIKNKIEKAPQKQLEEKIQFDDNVFLNDPIIELLCDIRNSENYKISFELLLNYLEKNPNIYNQIEKSIVDYWIMVDLNPSFEIESFVINKLFSKVKEKNISEIYKHMLKTAITKGLKTQYQIIKPGKNSRTIEFINVTLNYTSKLCQYRNHIWNIIIKTLSIYPDFESIFVDDYSIWAFNEEKNRIMESDIRYLNKVLFTKWEKPTLREWKIIDLIKTMCSENHVNIPQNIYNLKESKKFQLLKILENYDYDKDENNTELGNIVNDNNDLIYQEIFDVLNDIKRNNIKVDDWKINKNLEILFESIKKKGDNYFEKVFTLYIKNNCPFISYPSYLISFANLNMKNTIMDIILINEFDYKYYVLSCLLENYEENINYLDIVKKFISNQKTNNVKYTFNVSVIIKYSKFDCNLLNTYTKQIIKSNDLNLFSRYLAIPKDFDEIQKIYNTFNDKHLLEELYIMTLPSHFADHSGYLGYLLVKNNFKFINKLIKKDNYNSGKLREIINYLWDDKDYMNLILKTYDAIKEEYLGYLGLYHLFENNKYEDKQIKWFKKYILNNLTNANNLKDVFRVIGTKKALIRKDLILFLLVHSEDERIIEGINLFSLRESWSGSRLPLIDKKISFLEELKQEINSKQEIKYLYCIQYLEECINIIKKDKRKVEIEEYLDDFLD